MSKSREKLIDSLRQLHHERRTLIRRLIRDRELAIGSVSTVRRKCGSTRCSCADGPGHLQTLFLFKDEKENRRRCKLIRRADEKWMLRAGENYHNFRKDIKRLRAIDLKEKQILMAISRKNAVVYE